MSVRQAYIEYMRQHNNDPRPFLDMYFWKTILYTRDPVCNLSEIEEWCQRTLGIENYVRVVHKIWFTDKECYTAFVIAWDTLIAERPKNEDYI